jgi:hypothetical protein
MNTAALNLVELNNDEMVEIAGGEPLTLTALALWAGAGLLAAGAGVAVGYLIAS